MAEADHHGSAMTLRDYLHVVRRRKWVILTAVVLVPAAAIAFSLHQTKLYQANAVVLLNAQNLATQLAGVSQPRAFRSRRPRSCRPRRSSPACRQSPRDVEQVGARASPRSSSSATPASRRPRTRISSPSRSRTTRRPSRNSSVDAYAGAYAKYRRQLDTASIKKALQGVNARLRQLQAAGENEQPLHRARREPADGSRRSRRCRLERLRRATGGQSAQDAAEDDSERDPRPPRPRARTRPRLLARRRSTRGFAAPRRSASAWAHTAARPVAAPPKRFARKDRLAMVDEPYGPCCGGVPDPAHEPRFACLGREIRSLMITSADRRGGQVDDDREPRRRARAHRQARRARRPRPAPPDSSAVSSDRRAGSHAGRTRPCDARSGARPDRAIPRCALQATSRRVERKRNGHRPSEVEGMLRVLPSGPDSSRPGRVRRDASACHDPRTPAGGTPTSSSSTHRRCCPSVTRWR